MSKDTFTLNIPISKIDEEQRIVTGIATSEALDSQGDIMDYDASKRAFSDWVGNIREMHNPVAVGKAIDVQFDDENKQVILSAKISQSADGENAWMKVKEGVLTGFSIGGRVSKIVKDKAVEGANRVVEYMLSETSLVDNPANPDAKLLMVKSADGKLQQAEALEQTAEVEIAKSVWDAREAIRLACELTYLMMVEGIENEPEQMSDLQAAFNALRNFAAKEVSEGDDYLFEGQETMALASKAINLKKGKEMAKEEVVKTNVIGGVERDEEAKVVVEAPVEVAKSDEVEAVAVEEAEVKAEAEVETEVVEEAEAEETEEAPEEVEAADETEVKESTEKEEKSDSASDLIKSVQSSIAKLNESNDAQLKKVADLVSDLNGKVEKQFAALEGRLKSIEDQPLPTKAKASYVTVVKGDEIDTNAELVELEKRQEFLATNPADAKPGEFESIFRKMRQLRAAK